MSIIPKDEHIKSPWNLCEDDNPARICDYCCDATWTTERLLGWPICEKCQSKVRDRIKLILKFE